MDFEVIKKLVNHNVPRYIKYFHDCGGVDEDEWKWLNYGYEEPWGYPRCSIYNEEQQKESVDPNHPHGVLAKADELLLFPKDYATFRNSLFVLVKALAIMSFIPGGVRFGNAIFNSQIDSYVEILE